MTPENVESDEQLVIAGIEMQRRLAATDAAERGPILIEAVREVASAVLDQPALKADSNFLESGLTSLRALELTHKLTTLTGIEISLVALIEHPTPADLGQFMADSSAGATTTQARQS